MNAETKLASADDRADDAADAVPADSPARLPLHPEIATWLRRLSVFSVALALWTIYLALAMRIDGLASPVLHLTRLALAGTGGGLLLVTLGGHRMRGRIIYGLAFAIIAVLHLLGVYLLLHLAVDIRVTGSGPAVGFSGLALIMVARNWLPWLRQPEVWDGILTHTTSPEQSFPRRLLQWYWQPILPNTPGHVAAHKTPSVKGKSAGGTGDKAPEGHALREYAEALIIALAMALVLRTFAIEAFRIPTDSMQTTLSGDRFDAERNPKGTGDRILVNKYAYATDGRVWEFFGFALCGAVMLGLGLSLSRRKRLGVKLAAGGAIAVGVLLFAGGYQRYAQAGPVPYAPERYDIVVFKYPLNTKRNFIKRLVGMSEEDLLIWRGDIWTRPAPGGLSNADLLFDIARKPVHVQGPTWIRSYTQAFAGRYGAVSQAERDRGGITDPSQCLAPIFPMTPGSSSISDWMPVPFGTSFHAVQERPRDYIVPDGRFDTETLDDTWSATGDGGPESRLVATDPPALEDDPACLVHTRLITDTFEMPANDAEYRRLDANYQRLLNNGDSDPRQIVGDVRLIATGLLDSPSAELGVRIHRDYEQTLTTTVHDTDIQQLGPVHLFRYDEFLLRIRGDGTAETQVLQPLTADKTRILTPRQCDVHWYTFKGFPAEEVRLSVSSDAFEPFVFFVGPSGTIEHGECAPGESTAQVVTTLQPVGIYRIGVTGVGVISGDYRLTLRVTEGTTLNRDGSAWQVRADETFSLDAALREDTQRRSLTDELAARGITPRVGEPFRFAFGQADHRIYISIDDVALTPWDLALLVAPPVQSNETIVAGYARVGQPGWDRPTLIALEARGGEGTHVSAWDIEIFRDIHYRPEEIVDPVITIPPERYLVLGDNCTDSKDSRRWYVGTFHMNTWNPQLVIEGPDGREWRDDNGGNGLGAALTFVVPRTGDYTIGVTRVDRPETPATRTVPYSLTVQFAPPPDGDPDSGPRVFTQVREGSLSPDDDASRELNFPIDYHVFTWLAGTEVTVSLPGEEIHAELDPPAGETRTMAVPLTALAPPPQRLGGPTWPQLSPRYHHDDPEFLRSALARTQQLIPRGGTFRIEDTSGTDRLVDPHRIVSVTLEPAPFVRQDQLIGQALVRFWPPGVLGFIE